MKKSKLLTTFEQINDWIFLLILVIYQIIFIFQGLDFADEGFYATFYQQIFADPQSVTFNFMHWLTGILGGTFFYLFPNAGLLGLRILGVIVVTSTIAIVYFSLKKHIKLLHLRLGLLILLLFISNDPKEMYYNNLSALICVISAVFLFSGLRDYNFFKIATSGAFVSLNMFTRTPGVVELIFFLAIIYYGFITGKKLSYQIKQVLIFGSGFVIMTIFILLLMKMIGHFSIYLESLRIMFGMGESEYDSHNIFKLIKLFLKDFVNSFIFGMLFLFFIIILSKIGASLTRASKFNPKIIVNLSKVVFIILFLYLTISQKITWNNVLFIFTGTSLIISILLLIMSNNNEIKLLVFLGCLILLFAPFGSAGGLSTMGRYSLWLIFPFTVDYLFNIKFIDIKLLFSNNQAHLLSVSINEEQLNKMKKYFVGLCIFFCLYNTYYYPYFDMSNRAHMNYSIENKFAKGIFTTKERATAINELLVESSKYVKKYDYVIAYDCIPMVHFLTETRPYMRNSWPWLYIPEAFDLELNKALNEHKELPVLILQKMNTLNSDWPKNSISYFQKSQPDFIRDSIINNFMKNNEYIKVWENIAFELQVPGDHLNRE